MAVPRVVSRRPIQCIVPPYMVEHMARSADPQLRERAVVDLARASAVRAVRTFSQQMPALLATASPTGRKHRLVYDARKKDLLPGRLVRSEGEPKTADPCVNEAYDYSGDTFDFFLERFARNSLDDDGMTLISSVHVGEADDPALGSDPQPDHMERIYTGPADSGGVHLNSGIPNRAFVLVAQTLGGPAWETPGAIWYEALLQLSRTSQFSDMAKLTAQIAGDRFGAATKKAVRAAWKKVGL